MFIRDKRWTTSTLSPASHLPRPFARRAAAISRISWENAYAIVEPQTNAEGIHVWPFDLEFPVDVRFFRFARGHHIRMTRHDYFELLYVDFGEVVYQIQDRFFTVREGDLLVISGTQYHRMAEFHRSRVKAALLYFLPDLLRAKDTNGEEIGYLMPFLVQDASFPHVVLSKTGIPGEIFDLIRRIHKESPHGSHLSRLAVKTYLKMILVLLVKHYADYPGTEQIFHQKQKNIERLRPLFEYIDRHYSDPLSVDDAASIVCMSKSHFMRFFKQVTGQPFVSHLNHFRIAKAQSLLKTTDLSIAEVSQESGFCDQSYFGLVFRKLVRMSPREYKLHAAEAPSMKFPKPFVADYLKT